MCEELFQAVFPTAHGVLCGTSVRRIPHISQALWAVILRWTRRDRTDYHIKQYVPKINITFRSDKFEHWSTTVIHSFDHQEELQHDLVPDMDWSDISGITPMDDAPSP
eukprot:1543813-Pyramimonas_sp.AAC.1